SVKGIAGDFPEDVRQSSAIRRRRLARSLGTERGGESHFAGNGPGDAARSFGHLIGPAGHRPPVPALGTAAPEQPLLVDAAAVALHFTVVGGSQLLRRRPPIRVSFGDLDYASHRLFQPVPQAPATGDTIQSLLPWTQLPFPPWKLSQHPVGV